jgi:putative DNA primase/helicase
MALDFAALAARLLSDARGLLPSWLPAGKFQGHEFKVGNLGGEPGDSLSININTGRWADFASGEAGGDLISLYAAIRGIGQAEACRALDNGAAPAPAQSSTPKPRAENPLEAWTPIVPAPDDAPPIPDHKYYKLADGLTWDKRKVVASWRYTDAEGRTVGHAARIEWHDGERLCKDIVPLTYCLTAKGERGWRWRAFPEPRPLYNLAELHARPEARVLVVEGEKKVEAARSGFSSAYVAVAWPGGAKAWRKVDWSPLNGRSVLLWPDNDKPGVEAMYAIGHALMKRCPEVKIIIPDESVPEKWDIADGVRDGWSSERLVRWARERVRSLSEGGNDGRTEQGVSERTEQGGAGAGGAGPGRSGDQHAAQTHAAGTPAPLAGAPAERAPSQGTDTARAGGRVALGQQHDATPEGAAQRSGSGRDGEPSERASAGQNLDRTETPGAASRAGSRLHEPERLLPQGDAARSTAGRWLEWGLQRNGQGAPLGNVSNAITVMEHDPQLRDLVYFDEFLQRLMLNRDPPREWTEADDIEVTIYMQRAIEVSRLGRDTVSQAIIAWAMRNRRNCVREWMDSLVHDGTPRAETFFVDVFGAEDNIYTRAAGRNFWTSIAARVYDPGCKFDNMIVLEGGQGIGKSMALAIIGGAWFAEQHESATNSKAFAEVLQGKLLVEISEMDAFNRAEVNTIKKVISCQSDRYRASYGRYAKDHPRQCVMVGTTNKDDWNRDETGARRFWPIACAGNVKLDLLRATREQLFAEGVARFRAGEPWWEMPEVETRAEQRKRYDADPWIEPISGWLNGQRKTNVNAIAVECLRLPMGEIDRARQMRIAGVLRALGWVNEGNKKRAGKVVREWSAPGDEYGTEVATENEVATSNGGSEAKPGSDLFNGGEVATQRSLPEDDIPFQ